MKWFSWKRLCVPKEFGGLGLKELKKFNLALLAKQGWRLLVEANPLVSAIMKARYYPKSSVLMAELGNNPSYVWRGIYKALGLVKDGARRKIGNGDSTTVWQIPWLPDVSNGFMHTEECTQLREIKVSNLMKMGEKVWDVDLLSDLFCPRDIALIKRIPIPMVDESDSWY